MNFFNNIRFKIPTDIDVLIYGEPHSELLISNILDGMSYYVYPIDIKKIYITRKIFFAYIKSFKVFDVKKILTKNNIIYSLIRELLMHWEWCTIKTINPKIVLTIIDNSGLYHWLAKKEKNMKFFAIQNGNRLYKELINIHKYYHQNLFCFGDHEKRQFMNNKHTVENYYPVGSLKLGIFKEKFYKNNYKIKYDLLIVSQFRPYINKEVQDLPSEHAENKINDAKLHEILSRVVRDNNYKTGIILTDLEIKKQIKYFSEYYQDNVEYIENNLNILKSYEAVMESKIILGISSTLIIEAFGFNKKVLCMDFDGHNNFNDYENIITLKNPSYEYINYRIKKLIDEPYESYISRTKHYSDYLMNFNEKYLPHDIIKSKIKKYIYGVID